MIKWVYIIVTYKRYIVPFLVGTGIPFGAGYSILFSTYPAVNNNPRYGTLEKSLKSFIRWTKPITQDRSSDMIG